MLLYPNAKINLGLNVINRRSDGFHDIETLFVPYPLLSDLLEVVYASEPKIFLYGIEYDGAPEDNLCWKAYKLMQQEYGIEPVEIHLLKKIPVGAGLGGGSADAAFTLKAIDYLFNLGLRDEVLASHAAKLGSDCPFFIYNRPMFASGRGEILTDFDIDLSEYRIEVATPPVFVSTREAYSGIKPHRPAEPLSDVLRLPVSEWKGALVNDFEATVFAAHPSLADVKEDFYNRGAVYVSMSGSGSSVFGIFKTATP